MSATVEKLEGNLANITVTVSAADFDAACKDAYNKTKGRFQIPGFRKGKVPMAMIEKMYGVGVFFEDAANDLINKTYPEELEQLDLEVVSRPEITVSQIEKGKDFIYVAKVAVKPEVKLGEYKGLEIVKVDAVVTDEEVDAQIEKDRKQNSRKVDVTDRAAQLQDEVKIDFEGFVDGEAFAGGKGEDYALVLGSHSFIDTFEDQIVGKNIGDEFDVNVTFPENYQAEELQGKPAVFKVKLNAITATELPELDDDFASDLGADSLDEYKANVRKTLEVKKSDAAQAEKENKAIDKLIEVSEMEIPDLMIESEAERIMQDFAQRLQYQGLNFDQYLQLTGQTRAQLLEQIKPDAVKRIQTRLVVQAVADVEDFEVTEEELTEELTKMAEQYQLEVEKIKEMLGEKELDGIKADLKCRKAAKFLADNAVEVEAAAETEAE